MLTGAASIVTCGRRIGVVVAVAALFIAPPLVRATSTIKSSSPLRLNRGFETPPSKADAVLSLEQVAEPVSADTREPPQAGRQSFSGDTSVPVAPSDHSPDPQRGPPASTLR
jgi:hypothetical protein